MSGGVYLKELQSSELLAKIERGEPLRYKNVILKGDLDLSLLSLNKDASGKRIVISEIELQNSKIEGKTDFRDIIFQNPISLLAVNFNGTVYFGGSQFNRVANFSGSKFEGDSQFGSVTFSETAIFVGSRFGGCVNFTNAQFKGDVSFSGSKFIKNAIFNGVRLGRTVIFRGAKFSGPAIFTASKFCGYSDFLEAQFQKNVDFDDTQFERPVSFQAVRFGGDAVFEDAIFNVELDLKRCKYDKLYIEWENIYNLAYDESSYQLLIENFKKLGLFDAADKCYYKFRLERLKIKNPIRSPIKYLFDLAAQISYGYGVKPERPLIWSIFVILLGGAFFYTNNSTLASPSSDISFGDALLFSANIFTSGMSSLVASSLKSSGNLLPSGISLYAVTIERFLGWILFVLFLASIGKTIVR